MHSAEIIAVGSELLTPQRTDTNSLWLTGKLNDIGVDVKLKTIVGDDEERLEEAVRDALKRSEIVITTGGLGPTEDDVTRQVCARAVGRSLIYRDDLESELVARFRRWGREMPEINKRQAFVIDGADVLPNPNGSASGMLLELDKQFLVVLPGPPRELQPMFNDFVFERIKAVSDGVAARRRVIRVSGMGESAVDEAIAPIYKSLPGLETSILFNKSEVEVHLTARGAEADGDALLQRATDEIERKLGPAVFATNGETLEEVVGRLLTGLGKTVAVAESCTGGVVSMRLTDVPGSSEYFLQGNVTYSNDAKIKILNVPPDILESHGAVSAETAEAMAAGARQLAGSDYAISTTGVAGPGGGSEAKPVGTVFIGFADESHASSIKLTLPGDRHLIRWRASQAALDHLRRQILRTTSGKKSGVNGPSREI